MRRLLCIRALLLVVLSVGLTACSDKNSAQPDEQTVDDSVFEQVRPAAFEDIEDPELQDKLEVSELGGLFQSHNRMAGLKAQFRPDGNFVWVEGDGVDSPVEMQIGFTKLQRTEGDDATQLQLTAAKKEGNIVRRKGGDFEEFFINRAEGIEHGLILGKRPAGKGRLLASVDVSGYIPRLSGPRSAVFDSKIAPSIQYKNLVVYDARGAHLPAFMTVVEERGGQRLVFDIDDREAVYPVVVDPVLSREFSRKWPEAIRVATSCSAPSDGICGFGRSVAIHGDVMVVGQPERGPSGAVDILMRDAHAPLCTADPDCENGTQCNLTVGRCLPGGTTTNRWGLVGTLTGDVGPSWVAFGSAVALSQRSGSERYLIAVGDPQANGEGRAELFQVSRTDLLNRNFAAMTRQLIGDNGGSSAIPNNQILVGTEFAYDVALTPDYVLFGHPEHDSGKGRVAKLNWVDGASFGGFSSHFDSAVGLRTGHSVAAHGDIIAAGSPKDDLQSQTVGFTLPSLGSAAGGETFDVTVTDSNLGSQTRSVMVASGDTETQLAPKLRSALAALTSYFASVSGTGTDVNLVTVPGVEVTLAFSTTLPGWSDPPLSVVTPTNIFSSVMYEDISVPFEREFSATQGDAALGHDVHVFESFVGGVTRVAELVGGAPKYDDGANVDAGGVFRWDITTSTGPVAIGSVFPGNSAGDRLGHTVFTTAQVTVAGGPGATTAGAANNGIVRNTNNTWGGVNLSSGAGNYTNNETFGTGRQLGYSIAFDPLSDPTDPVWTSGAPGLTYDRFPGGNDRAQGATVVYQAGNLRDIARPQGDLAQMQFGADVDSNGDIMVVSAPGHNSHYANPRTGAVYVYRRGPTSRPNDWQLMEVLEPPPQFATTGPPYQLESFGSKVATNGSVIAVETHFDWMGSDANAITFYSADLSTNTVSRMNGISTGFFTNGWPVLDVLGAPTSGDLAMDFEGNTFVVGSGADNVAYQYDISPMPFTEVKLHDNAIANGKALGEFGASVATNGSVDPVVAVGDPAQDQVHFFTRTIGEYVSTLPDDSSFMPGLAPSGGFGSGLAMSPDNRYLAVSAPLKGDGSIYFFRFDLFFGGTVQVTWPLDQFGSNQDYQEATQDNWDPFLTATGQSLVTGAKMGQVMEMDTAMGGAIRTLVTNDWARDAVLSYRWDPMAGFWIENDFTRPADGVNDDPSNVDAFEFPNALTIPDGSIISANPYAVAGSPASAFEAFTGVFADTGSVVFTPFGTPVLDADCDGVDDDGDGVADDDSCGPLGAAGCVDTAADPGVCYATCDLPATPCMDVTDSCLIVPAVSGTISVCVPQATGCAGNEISRNGRCIRTCDPINNINSDCNVGDRCYIDPSSPTTGLCAPDTDVCNSPAFGCGILSSLNQYCHRGDCRTDCPLIGTCGVQPGLAGTNCNTADLAGDYCDDGNPCDNVWCPADEPVCHLGECFAVCDSSPSPGGDGLCDLPSKQCYNDGGSAQAVCLEGADACAGISCPVDGNGDEQTCYEGECFEYCDNVDTTCSTAGDVCDQVNSFCKPADICGNIWCLDTETCLEGTCVQACDSAAADTCTGAGESCVQRPGSMTATDGVCLDTNDPCANISCPPVMGNPQTCYRGQCVVECQMDSECPGPNDVCAGSGAVAGPCLAPDICDQIVCPTNGTCANGQCYSTCDPALNSTDCAAGEVCAVDPASPTNGRCVDDVPDLCAGIVCPRTDTGIEQLCFEGSCYPTCVDDNDCEPPNICYDSVAGNFCNVPDPCDSVWCPLGDVCFAGSCFETCTACGDTCYDNLDGSDRCSTSSCDGVLCPLGDVCMNGVCGAPCTTTSDCPDSHLCEDGCSVVPPDSDCALSGGGRCLPSDCDRVNCGSMQSCSSGVCGTSCMTDGECGAGEVCHDGACIADPCNPDPCPAGDVCHGGACYDQCTSATVGEDCRAGQICDGGRCSDGACTGIDCPLGQVCFDGSCYDPCSADGDCTPPNLCFNGVCAADPCAGVSCPLGEVCYGGSCAAPCGSTTACQNDSQCSGGETCENINVTTTWGYCMDCGTDECWVLGCIDDTDCATGDYCFKNGTSLSGICLETGCDPTGASPCSVGTLSCRTSECEGVQCPLGQVCYDGSCYNPCMDSGDCTPPNECYDGVCTDDLCRGTHCPLGQVCYAGSCYDPCGDDGDCTPPNECYEGRCADTACTGVNCPLGDVCVQGGCFEGCTVNTDCSEFIGTGDFTNTAGSDLAIPSDKDGGFVWADFNKDGCLDLAVNGRGSVNTRILMSDCNLPNPAFTDITPSNADELYFTQQARSIVAGDFNNDGYRDLVRTGSDTEMYLNRWDGVDTSDGSVGWLIDSWGVGGANTANQKWGGNPEGAGILDYDGDEDLDFIVQDGDRIALFTNNGSGTFSRSTPGSLDADEAGDYCAVADFDVDGDVDILCRFEEKNDSDGRDLYVNTGGSFSSSSMIDEDGANSDKSGVVFCDYDNDGDFDLFWGGEGVNQFWEQPSSGGWIETGKPLPSSGFDLNQGNREVEGVDCGDVDNDGDMDLFVARGREDKLFINQLVETGSATFVVDNRGIAENTGNDSEQGTMVDFDNDGDLDIYINHDNANYMWENPLTGNDYLMIRPRVDLGSGVYRDAIGATITIRDPDGGMLGVREVNGGSGRGSQRQIPVHFGLQNGDNVPYHLTVQFPHNPVEVVEVCVIPNTLSGYRVIAIDNTDADDMAACSDPNWASNIITAASGEFCFEDHCAANACDGIQCSSGFICSGGSCVESCTLDTDCPDFPMDICYQNRCADANNPACDNVKCPSNQTCYAGECFKDCAGPSDCDGNQFCYQGRCADPTCNKIAGNCLAGEVCHEGTCFRDCSTNPSICPVGESCWAGRCATDSCAAMMGDYEANHIFNATGKKLTADQYSRPYSWPRPLVGPAGITLADFAQYDNVAGTSNVGNIHKTNTARVVLYLDETLKDGANGEGQYVLWLTHGRSTAGQGPARANYQVRLKHSGNARLDTQFIDDGNESHRRMIDGTEEIVVAQITSGSGTTGGIALGPLPARTDDWTITIDASFTGAIDTWELYNPELNTFTTLKQGEQLTLRSLPISPDIILAPEVGFACDMPPEALLQGNCDNGVLACTTSNLGYTRCDQAVFPAQFEICDGEDNNCAGGVDEAAGMRIPYTQFNQNDGWKYWVPADSSDDFTTDLNYTQRGTDDRTGSTNYIGLEGTPMQGTQKSIVFQHRDLMQGDLTIGFLHGANAASGSDRNVEMRLAYTGDGTAGSATFRDGFIAYYDDAYPAADEVPKSLNAGNFEVDLEWQLDEISGTRESDGIGIRPNFHQYATGKRSYLGMEFRGTDGNDDDWTNDGLQWLMYQPRLLNGDNENELLKSRDLDMRVSGVGIPFSFCPAAVPVTVTDLAGNITDQCELGRYTCGPGGVLTCGAALLAACDICVDNDLDGYPLYDPALCSNGTDCNDEDPNIYPGAPERCNGLDDDCDTQVDVKTNVSGGDCGPGGGAECGPAECNYANICVCPDGPENPNDPPSEPCYCGSSQEVGDEPAEAIPANDPALFEDRGAACSAAGTPVEGDLPLLLLVGVGAVAWRRRRRR